MLYLTQIQGPFIPAEGSTTVSISDIKKYGKLKRVAFHLADWCPLKRIAPIQPEEGEWQENAIKLIFKSSEETEGAAIIGSFIIGQTGLFELADDGLNNCDVITIELPNNRQSLPASCSIELWSAEMQQEQPGTT